MRAVVIFARSPEREALAKGLRVERAAPLFRAFTARWLREAQRVGAQAIVVCDGDLGAIAPEIERIHIAQRGVTFGDRVANASADAFALGFTEVVIAAIDAPPMSLDTAFDALERGIAVIAPSRDGGVNFIGLTAPEPELLARIELRERNLVRAFRAYFDQLLVLAAANDIDSAADLVSPIFVVDEFAPRHGVTIRIASRGPPAAA